MENVTSNPADFSMSWLMKLKLTLITGAAVHVVLMTQSIAAETLTIQVDNVSFAEGSVMVQVLPGEAGFKGETPAAASLMQPAKLGSMTFIAPDISAGDYAIRVMHDVNGNGELDANFIGMPTEPWGMSNNARGNFGPPQWQDVKFTLQGDTTHIITLSK
jgi:uncharacterized protein (DUF2141 family)